MSEKQKQKQKQKQKSAKLAHGMPLAPWIFVNNAVDNSNLHANALCSLIPQSRIYEASKCSASPYKDPEHHAIPIYVDSSTVANQAASTARDCQVKALKRGCNMASISLCNTTNYRTFTNVDKHDWPTNHFITNVEGAPVEEVAKTIQKWLFTVLSVRETLHLIPESDMLLIDTVHYSDYKYSTLWNAANQRKNTKLQFVALIASKPEVTEPNVLTWKVVDRTGEARFHFQHRGPLSQYTWDCVLNFKPGERKVLARMPMVAVHEPLAKKISLSPLRATGATIRGIGHVAIGIGTGVHWIGDKISMRRSEKQKFVPEVEWEENEAARKAKEELRAKEKEERKQVKKGCSGAAKFVRYMTNANIVKNEGENKKSGRGEFDDFNEKGEKDRKDSEEDAASTVAGSVMDEKTQKEFC